MRTQTLAILICVCLLVVMAGMLTLKAAHVRLPIVSINGLGRDEHAESLNCGSNLTQIGTGLKMYLEDYDGKIPPKDLWEAATLPYIKVPEVFRCPATDGKGGGYAFNGNISAINLNSLRDPHSLVAVADAPLGLKFAMGPDKIAPRHMGGANLLFCDGHVSWILDIRSTLWKLSEREAHHSSSIPSKR